MLIRRTTLRIYEKLSYEALNRRFCQSYVDAAVIGGRKKLLPGEISAHSCNAGREVSRSHSSFRQRAGKITGGLKETMKG